MRFLHCLLAAITLIALSGCGITKSNEIDPGASTPLHDAVAAGDMEAVTSLLANGANVNEIAHGRTPLHEAVRQDDPEMVEFLIASGADVNAKDVLDFTPQELADHLDKVEAYAVLSGQPRTEEEVRQMKGDTSVF